MRKTLSLFLFFGFGSVNGQKLSFVKDSILNYYMESGYANKHFIPQGKEDQKGRRQGSWNDFEVKKDFAYVMENGKPKQVFGNFLLFGEGDFTDGKRYGAWKFYVIEDRSFKRILQKQVNFSEGKENGAFTYFYPSGKVGIRGNYFDGILEGEVKSYYENGNLYGTRIYQKGFRTGRHTYLYSNGQLELEHNFINDTLNGLYQTYYPDGKVQESFHYKKGEMDDIYHYYYDNGQLWVEKEYKEGLLMNVTGSYDKQGKKRDKGSLLNGNGTINYYTEDGKVYSIETYLNGKKIKEESF